MSDYRFCGWTRYFFNGFWCGKREWVKWPRLVHCLTGWSTTMIMQKLLGILNDKLWLLPSQTVHCCTTISLPRIPKALLYTEDVSQTLSLTEGDATSIYVHGSGNWEFANCWSGGGSNSLDVSENPYIYIYILILDTLKPLKAHLTVYYNLTYLYFSFEENHLWSLQKVTVAELLLVAFILYEQLQITLFNICFICVSELILVLQQRQTCLMRIKIILNWILLWEFLSIT